MFADFERYALVSCSAKGGSLKICLKKILDARSSCINVSATALPVLHSLSNADFLLDFHWPLKCYI